MAWSGGAHTSRYANLPTFPSARWASKLVPVDTIETFKDFLGAAGNYTEAELWQLRQEMHAMAELLLDIYLYRKRGSTSTIEEDGGSGFDT
jgi:hypothetical protein